MGNIVEHKYWNGSYENRELYIANPKADYLAQYNSY